jgi:hypothetical protein
MKGPSRSEMLVPIQGTWIDSRIPQIARRLQERDPSLEIRAFCGPKRSRILQYEVWWKNQFVARFLPHEVDMIEQEMAMLDRNTPGHVETIDKLERQDAERERDASRKFEDVYMAMLEHYTRLETELEDGKTFHGQAGYGDSPIFKK